MSFPLAVQQPMPSWKPAHNLGAGHLPPRFSQVQIGSFETLFGCRKQFLCAMHVARSIRALPCLKASKDLALQSWTEPFNRLQSIFPDRGLQFFDCANAELLVQLHDLVGA